MGAPQGIRSDILEVEQTTMARYKIIVNPTSGRGVGGESIPVLEAGQALQLDRLEADHRVEADPHPVAEVAALREQPA